MSEHSGLGEFEAVQATLRKSGYAGWYERIKDELTDEQRESLHAALQSKHLTARAISLVLKKWGYDVSLQAVSEYRRRTYG